MKRTPRSLQSRSQLTEVHQRRGINSVGQTPFLRDGAAAGATLSRNNSVQVGSAGTGAVYKINNFVPTNSGVSRFRCALAAARSQGGLKGLQGRGGSVGTVRATGHERTERETRGKRKRGRIWGAPVDKGNLSSLRCRPTCNFPEIEDGILAGAGRARLRSYFYDSAGRM